MTDSDMADLAIRVIERAETRLAMLDVYDSDTAHRWPVLVLFEQNDAWEARVVGCEFFDDCPSVDVRKFVLTDPRKMDPPNPYAVSVVCMPMRGSIFVCRAIVAPDSTSGVN